jgi:hypothetical protein
MSGSLYRVLGLGRVFPRTATVAGFVLFSVLAQAQTLVDLSPGR